MDVRRELSMIRKHYASYQKQSGESIMWFEFVPLGASASASSLYDDVYDEGTPGTGGRRYKAGVVVPVLMITESEDQKRAIPEGRQPVQLVNFVASLDDFRAAGVTAPWEYQPRLNDMFLYDGRYFSVVSYRVRGRARDDVMLVVEGIETYISQEMVNDVGPASYAVANYPWPATIANLG